MGHGESGDRGKAQPLPARGVVVLPPGTIHSVYAETDTILQVNGMGPFDIKYVNQKDDPRAKSQ
jgi:hypothetical protein